MIAPALLSLASLFATTFATTFPATAPSHAPLPSISIQDEGEGEVVDEYQKRLEEAGEDADALWVLQKWCKAEGKILQARECLKKIVTVAPNHKDARKALGHHFYDEKWFESYFALTEYKRDEEKRMLDEKGLVRFENTWVPEADKPYLLLGMVREEETGEWVTKRELDRRVLEAKYIREEWVQQRDLVWVAPDEKENWEKGLWKCGEKWLSLEEANAFHSRINQWWTLPSGENHFEVWSTCSFVATEWAGWHADRTYKDLVRAYGKWPDPKKPPVVAVLNSQSQYNSFAAGDQGMRLPATESQGFSSVHYAYFADSWIRPVNPPEYLGTGVALWNMQSTQTDSKGLPDPFGAHAVRHAAALSFAEAIDPSLETISRVAASQGNFPFQAFWREKKIPFWFRVGVAAYCERYFIDEFANRDAGYGPLWAREWSLGNIRSKGGPLPFDQIFAMQLNPNDIPGSQMRINQAGMLVSFILDGECEAVSAAHAVLREALRTGEGAAEADKGLREAIAASEEEFHVFVKM